MNFFTKLATTIGAATLLFSTTPVHATGTIEEHQVLMNSLQAVGVNVYVNPRKCLEHEDLNGAYWPGLRTLMICQDNARIYNGRMIPWTDADLNTLRHEAHHVVQDCNNGGLGDSRSSRLFQNTKQLSNFIGNAMSPEQFMHIVRVYDEAGTSTRDILMETEAFAVAETVSPLTISRKLIEFCGVN